MELSGALDITVGGEAIAMEIGGLRLCREM